jgi:hypothetical protein
VWRVVADGFTACPVTRSYRSATLLGDGSLVGSLVSVIGVAARGEMVVDLMS